MTQMPNEHHDEHQENNSADKLKRGGFGRVQWYAMWVVAIFAIAAAVLMTLNVMFRGAPGMRGTITDVSPYGKPPLLLSAPQWKLTDAFGKTLSNEDFKGKVVVYDTIFTQCKLVCPVMAMRMFDLQKTLDGAPGRDDIQFVSISIDGKNDTPGVLKKYGYDKETGVGADPRYWHFVTGDQKVVWPLVQDEFKLPLEMQPEVEGMPIAHSAKFVLVDKDGRIYNYYDMDSAEERSAILADIQRLMNE